MSISAKEEILGRIRSALTDVVDKDPQESPIEWVYGQPTAAQNIVNLFLERVEDYKADVEHVSRGDLPAAIVRHLQSASVESVVLPAGLDKSWRKAIEDAGFDVRDDDNLSAAQLNEINAVVTAAAVGVAETGTFVMDHRPDQGRRALTLVPDVHICVLREDQIVTDVPESISRLKASVVEGWPLTMVSGPSATSDIELNRVEGVHGPRILHVIVSD